MALSLNEIDATAKRATRGAGYDWGLAEEAGRAVRWLCAQGLDGGAALAAVLAAGFAADLAAHRPQRLRGDWHGARLLCPLATGAVLSDCAARLAQADQRVGPMAQPALILPFAAMAARQIGACVTVEADDLRAITDGTHLQLDGALAPSVSGLNLRRAGVITTPRAPCSRATPDPDALAALTRFAHQTFAPATEASRRLGAGDGGAGS